MPPADRIRNLAIIAHIDHGKTTLIDAIFREARTFRENARIEERVMDSNVLERERGITIRAKHCAVEWEDCLINIIDTPGHADFSGEVERVLSMVDGALLLVDANEGPMPQTRYVLMRALRLGLRVIVIVNKIDRPKADAAGTLNETFNLFMELGASDHQADFPTLYGSGLEGWLVRDPEKEPHEGMAALFETIIREIPPPAVDRAKPFRMQVGSLAWSNYLGQIACGRVLQGAHRKGEPLLRTRTRWKGEAADRSEWETVETAQGTSTRLWVTRGLEREETVEAAAGDIIWLAGMEGVGIGDTLSAPECPEPAMPPLEIEEPTVSAFFLINNGPFGGEDGAAASMRQIKERLEHETRTNVALRVEDLGRTDGVKVSGRGELHLGILMEEMRREGMEFCVSRPEVITKRAENGALLEPIEQVVIDAPDEYQGVIIRKLALRKGELLNMHNAGTGLMRMEFKAPTRGLIGYRAEMLTDTRGLATMASRFIGYAPWCGEVVSRNRGSMISMDTGIGTGYSLENLQQRGQLFIAPTDRVYAGMIIGEHSRPNDLPCNPTKGKRLTNHRQANREIDAIMAVPRRMALEEALDWIADDELVEVTPKSIRVRKMVLSAEERKKIERRPALTA